MTDPKFADTRLAIASRCDEPNWARQLLGLFTVGGPWRSPPRHLDHETPTAPPDQCSAVSIVDPLPFGIFKCMGPTSVVLARPCASRPFYTRCLLRAPVHPLFVFLRNVCVFFVFFNVFPFVHGPPARHRHQHRLMTAAPHWGSLRRMLRSSTPTRLTVRTTGDPRALRNFFLLFLPVMSMFPTGFSVFDPLCWQLLQPWRCGRPIKNERVWEAGSGIACKGCVVGGCVPRSDHQDIFFIYI